MTHNLSSCYHADMTTKRLGLGSAKLEVLPKHNRILSTVTIKYIFVIKNPSSGIWSCPFSIIASKTGVTSIEVYVSDIIGRRFEKVKNGHIFENWTRFEDWTSIRDWTSILVYISIYRYIDIYYTNTAFL